jgi:type IV pilus assembly protein PilW
MSKALTLRSDRPLRPLRQRGLTLVELMVALVVSLVLILAATTLYLHTRAAQKATDERAQVFDTAHLVMNILGKELNKAGFYPRGAYVIPIPGEAIKSPVEGKFTYEEVIARMAGPTVPAGLAHGIFGCDGKKVANGYASCGTAATGAGGSDALLVSYFTNDAFSLDVGDRADCQRHDVANDPTYNQTRYAAAPAAGEAAVDPVSIGTQPMAPLLVINRFYLEQEKYATEGGETVTTRGLRCVGNGQSASPAGSSLVVGVEQLGLRYGIADDADGAPKRFLTADEVSALPVTVISEKDVSGWQRVVAVEVCVLARSFSKTDLNSAGVSVQDCNGDPLTTDTGVVVRKMVQVFGLKNRAALVGGL